MRTEQDLLGDIAVPTDALYGAQTQRAVENFPVRGGRTLGDFPSLVRGLVFCKQAAALANERAGVLDADIARTIAAQCVSLLNQESYREFPIHPLHGGGGTSANMNANEVLANLAEESLGSRRGEYNKVHPNDHVNLNQSTNDVYPTACHIAVISQWPETKCALEALTTAIRSQAESLSTHKRIARTCLQDAVAVSFGDLLGGYASFLARVIEKIDQTVAALYAVSLGGTIVGRAEDVPPTYMTAIIPALREVTGDPRYQHHENLFDAAQNLDDMVRVSGEIELLARGLIKISKDLRLMNSGPETGLGEVLLPPVQPGSSIMPGKVNPVIPEFVIQLCFRIKGNHAMCQSVLDHGELDLNIWESTVVVGILESMELIQEAAVALADKCIAGLKVDAERNRHNSETIIPHLTELTQRYGYSRVNQVCKKARGDLKLLRQMLKETFPEA